jgi:phosphonate transport system substrate-binding protein
MSITEKFIIIALLVIPVMCVSMHCVSTTEQPADKQSANGQDKDIVIKPERMSNAPEVLRIAYAPSIKSGEVVERNKLLDEILSDKLGIPVESSVMTNYVASITGLTSGKIDCVMMNPLGYVLGRERYAVDVILKVKRNDSTEYNSQIIVNHKSGIDTLADLKGHTFAFVDRMSTSGHMYPREMLLRNNIEVDKDLSDRPAFVGSHDKVAIDVMNGVFDAGATFQDVRERLTDKFPDIMSKTKVIAVVGPIPNDMFCVSSDLDHEFKLKLINALKEISQGVEIDGEIVKPFYGMDKIEELVDASDSDYDPVRNVIRNLDMGLLPEDTE